MKSAWRFSPLVWEASEYQKRRSAHWTVQPLPLVPLFQLHRDRHYLRVAKPQIPTCVEILKGPRFARYRHAQFKTDCGRLVAHCDGASLPSNSSMTFSLCKLPRPALQRRSSRRCVSLVRTQAQLTARPQIQPRNKLLLTCPCHSKDHWRKPLILLLRRQSRRTGLWSRGPPGKYSRRQRVAPHRQISIKPSPPHAWINCGSVAEIRCRIANWV